MSEEQPVNEEQTLSEAVSEATAEATEEANEIYGVKEEPAVEAETPEAEPEAEPAAEAEAAEEQEDDPLAEHLTAQDLEAINSNPELQKAYKSMQRGLTKKATELSTRSKDLETKAGVADWVQNNPRKALEILAASEGIKLPDAIEAKAEETAISDTVATVMAKWEKQLGPEAANILGPLVRETAETIATNLVRQQLGPIQQKFESRERESGINTLRTAVSRFGAAVQERGDEWNDAIVQEMADEMNVVSPAEGTNTEQFLDSIYDRVLMRRSRANAKRTQLKRLRAAKTSAEPTTTVRPSTEEDEEITDEMSDRDAIRIAVRRAQSEATA